MTSGLAASAQRLVSSPRAVAATVGVLYGGWIIAVLLVHPSPYAFVDPGRHYVQLADQKGLGLPSLPAQYGAGAANPSYYGYDGQFTWLLALHPVGARGVLDNPLYRYQRILEPVVVAALSFGQKALVPWLMLGFSWLAPIVGAWAAAAWLVGRRRAPGWALLYGLWPGVVVTVRNDLTDGIAYSLVAVALLLIDSPRKSRPVLASGVMAVAMFARQEVAIYTAMMALGLALGLFGDESSRVAPVRHRVTAAVRFVATSSVPFGAYLLFLSHWLASTPNPPPNPLSMPAPEVVADVFLLLVPSVVALWALLPSGCGWRSATTWGWATYAVHVVALLGFMAVGQVGVYYSWSFSTVFRYYIPAALGVLVCSGYARRPSRARTASLLVGAGLVGIAVPVIVARGF